MKVTTPRMSLALAVAQLLIVAGVAAAADLPATVRAAVKAEKDRKPAPDFALKDASGKSVKLSAYRGEVVLLNFWATWCGGCKVEIPWFSEFEKAYGPRRFAVLGVSMDADGWGAVKPFVDKTKVTYRMLLGDDPIAQKYGVQSLPSTFIIDRQGRIAATHAGLVSKSDVEAEIKAMLAKR